MNDIGVYLREGSFEFDIRIANLHASKGMHWVCYINENYFDSYGCVCPKNLSKFMIKRNAYCLYSEYEKQGLTSKRDFFCPSNSLYIIYLTKV